MEYVLAIILGTAFGYALYVVGAASPKKLLSMLRLEDLSLMKIILFGIGFASTLLSTALLLGIIDVTHIHIKATNLGVVLGGIIFGLGFGMAGTCPGTCVAAIGTRGVKRAVSAALGGLVGAFAFSLTYGWWERTGLFERMNFGKITWFHLTDGYDSVFSIGPFGLLLTGIAFMTIAYKIPSYVRRGESGKSME